jgi:hypothetical protein
MNRQSPLLASPEMSSNQQLHSSNRPKLITNKNYSHNYYRNVSESRPIIEAMFSLNSPPYSSSPPPRSQNKSLAPPLLSTPPSRNSRPSPPPPSMRGYTPPYSSTYMLPAYYNPQVLVPMQSTILGPYRHPPIFVPPQPKPFSSNRSNPTNFNHSGRKKWN